MRKWITYIICTLFLFSISGSALAVEKKTKDKEATTQKKETPKETEVKKTNPTMTATTTKVDNKKKYDNFIDKNKNGIDDRREDLKSTSAPKNATASETKKKDADKKDVKVEVKKDVKKNDTKEKKKD